MKFQAAPPVWLVAKAPLLVAGLLLVLLAHSAAQLTWKLIPLSQESVSTSRTSRPAERIRLPQASPSDLSVVANAHLFGQVQAGPVSKGPIKAPVTRLKLTLKGVFASADPSVALAIIASANGEQKYYRIGDAVPGGAKVHAIYADRVILDRLGKLETLQLPREVAAMNAVVSPLPRRRPATATRHRLPSASTTVHQVKASEKVKQLREKMLKSPQEVWKDIRIEPVMESGSIRGYRFSHKDRQIMQSLGLQGSDVITEINGMPLSDPTALYEIMGQFSTDQEVRLTIERKNRTETIEVKL